MTLGARRWRTALAHGAGARRWRAALAWQLDVAAQARCTTATAAAASTNARRDSAFVAQAAAQREALDTTRRQLAQLLAGPCVTERDMMARVVFGCGGGHGVSW